MRHDHPDPERLTFGCRACVKVADEARWTNAPARRITFRALVPRHVTTLNGKQVEWTFTARCQIPDNLNWRGDDEIDYGRFDVGAEMSKTMPVGEYDHMDALATADLYIVKVEPIESEPLAEQGVMFA